MLHTAGVEDVSVKDVLCALLVAVNEYVQGGKDRKFGTGHKVADSEVRRDGGLFVVINLRYLYLNFTGVRRGNKKKRRPVNS